MSSRALVTALLFVLLLDSGALPVVAKPPADPPVRGPLVLVGGALSADNSVYREILAVTLPDRPLCVLATASSRPRESLETHVAEFRRFAGEEAVVPIAIDSRHPERAHKRRWARRIEGCGGFFFTGGDQSRILDLLRPGGVSSLADQALRRVAAEGGVVAGTSAGAAMMSQPMIGDGNSIDALRYGVTREEGVPGVWLREGMGFLGGAVVDQHFLARGRLGRLLVALSQTPHLRFGFGIDEDTGFVVTRTTARVVGRSSVVVLDQAGERTRLWLLANGDHIRLATGIAEPAPDKRPAKTVAVPEAPDDPWVDDTLHQFLIAFARADVATTAIPAGREWLRISKADGFRQAARGTAENPRALFAGPFEVELTAVR